MTDDRILFAVAFDADRYLPPLRRFHQRIDVGAPDWRGWEVTVEGDEVRILSPVAPTNGVPEYIKEQAGASTPVRMLTIVPRGVCMLSWAVPQAKVVHAESVASVVSAPDAMPLITAVSLAGAASETTSPPPTRRPRQLPPGARHSVEPPPSLIGIDGPDELPRCQHELIVD